MQQFWVVYFQFWLQSAQIEFPPFVCSQQFFVTEQVGGDLGALTVKISCGLCTPPEHSGSGSLRHPGLEASIQPAQLG